MLAELKALSKLETLDLDATRITDAGLGELAKSRRCATCRCCAGGRHRCGDAGPGEGERTAQAEPRQHADRRSAGPKELTALGQLRKLDLSGTGVTSKGLAPLGKLTELRAPVADGDEGRRRGTRAPRRAEAARGAGPGRYANYRRGRAKPAPLKKLRVLGLRQANIRGKGLSALKDFANLRELYLGGSNVGNGTLPILAGFKGLELLDLTFTEVTDAGLKELAALGSLTEVGAGRLRAWPVEYPILPRVLSVSG